MSREQRNSPTPCPPVEILEGFVLPAEPSMPKVGQVSKKAQNK